MNKEVYAVDDLIEVVGGPYCGMKIPNIKDEITMFYLDKMYVYKITEGLNDNIVYKLLRISK